MPLPQPPEKKKKKKNTHGNIRVGQAVSRGDAALLPCSSEAEVLQECGVASQLGDLNHNPIKTCFEVSV